MCITDRHDMTLAVKVALNPNTTNQHINFLLDTIYTKFNKSISLASIKFRFYEN